MVSKFRISGIGAIVLCLFAVGGVFAQEIQVIPSPVAPPTTQFAPPTSAPPAQIPGQPVGVPPTTAAPGIPTTPTMPTGPTMPTMPAGVPQTTPGQFPTAQPPVPGQYQAPIPVAPPTVQSPYPYSGVPGPGSPGFPPAPPPPAAPLPYGAEPPSPFETFVSGRTPTTISFDIKQFGYDLFRETFPTAPAPGTTGVQPSAGATGAMGGVAQALGLAPQAGAPAPTSPFDMSVQNVPVSPDYLIGPNDEIRISVWGSVEGAWNVIVDRDGNITLPKIGIVGVTGLKFSELKDALQKELAKYYTDFQMNVTMGALKTIRVYVVGNARTPGAHMVSSLSTLINGLISSGGPSKAGSMRDIQLRRNGDPVARLDLYDLLLKGDKSQDQRLMPEDVIFIPPIGPMVGVAGSVERPAIYEMKERVRLSEAIKMAGGVTADAFLARVQVERVDQRRSKVVVDLDMQRVKGKDDILLQDGDIVKVFPITGIITNKVVLKGNVQRPGEYQWRCGMRVKDLIPSYDSLLPDSNLAYALVERLVPPDNHQEYRTFSLEAAISGRDENENLLLKPYDTVTVYSKWELQEKDKVRVSGAVNRPGEFEFRPNMKLSDLLKLSGGMKRFAFTATAELTRVTPTEAGPLTEQIIVRPSDALAGDVVSDIILKEDDYLFVRSMPEWQIYRKVSIAGEVRFPGEYALAKGEKLSSLIERAGGFTRKAYLRGTTFTRLSVKDAQQKQLTDMINRVERELLAMSSTEASSGLDKDEAANLVFQEREKKLFLESLRYIEPKGRMVVKLDVPQNLKNAPSDVEMEEGDTIYIPTNPNSIQVFGAVMSQSSFVFEPRRDYSYYVAMAGGYSRSADKSRTYIMKVDGSAIRPNGGIFWDHDSYRWQTGSSALLEPGDTVVVPEKLERWTWIRDSRDLIQMLYQIAIGAGVLLRI